jgi:hypothetical protein
VTVFRGSLASGIVVDAEGGMVGMRVGRFSYKMERELIAMAAKGASISQIAARFRTTVATVERKAKRLGVSIKPKKAARSR